MSGDLSSQVRLGVHRVLQFSRLLLHHFIADGAMQHSAALTFTTLLSLVPLMTVTVALFSVFPASERLVGQIEEFVFRNFVPAAGEAVQRHLLNFSQQAAQLTGVGFAFLILVALMLMANIDQALNTIWHVRRKRSSISTFLVYWAILSLGPLLIVMSVAVTSYLASLPLYFDAETVERLRSGLLGLMPVSISTLAFTLIYALVPNRSVPVRHALAGGVLAALLFEVAKRGFVLYVTHFPTYQAIYGTMAVVPIFLVWLYLSWMVTLLAAEFTYCLGVYRDDWQATQGRRGSEFLLAARLLKQLRDAQSQGMQLSGHQLSQAESRAKDEDLEAILEKLLEGGLVLRTEDKRWALARDLRKVTLLDLYLVAPFTLPDRQELAQESSRLAQVLEELDGRIREGMHWPLDELL